ncbi:MAG TPA: ABC transporter ATP-binding protein [Propionibacteriaceae bacterium]|nr:ABC transporter ATP-binding protein [Propionibacteriaceae bacterium]
MTDRAADRELPGAVMAELRGVSKTYGSGGSAVLAVEGVDLSVRAGELLAVLGPNGAGKTTVLGMLTGLTTPSSGTARLFGRDPRDLGARQRMGVMLQSSGVPDTLRVRELLTAFRGYYPAPLPVASVVEAAGLHGLENRLFGTLSGGQQRRVLFGIALCGDPQLVFVDEPTTGLDAEVRRTLWATLRTLAATGRGVVLTTHYLEEADALADRIVLLHEGRVIVEGTPSQIKSLVPGRRITAESSIEAGQASGWAGVRHAQRDGTRLELLVSEPEPVLRELLQRDQSVTGVTVTEPTLEDAFLTLTDRRKEAA